MQVLRINCNTTCNTPETPYSVRVFGILRLVSDANVIRHVLQLEVKSVLHDVLQVGLRAGGTGVNGCITRCITTGKLIISATDYTEMKLRDIGTKHNDETRHNEDTSGGESNG